MNDGEVGWLAEHLGHELNVHKNSYRVHTSAIQVSKVGRILSALDSGNILSQQGRSLETLDIQPGKCSVLICTGEGGDKEDFIKYYDN